MCCGPTAKWKREEVPLHKFDFIDVDEFREWHWITRLKYSAIFLLVLKSVLTYVADIWTASILLVSSGDWQAAGLRPVIRLDYARFVHLFSIVCSFLLLAWEASKARAVLRSRDIGLAYTSPFCYRFLVLRSYPHYCFFANITRSQRSTDRMAFFVFFVLKGWKRVLFAEAPRQVVNGVTLYALLTTNPKSPNDRTSVLVRIYQLTAKDAAPFLALCCMTFAFTIFMLSALLSLFAVLLYFPLLCRIRGNLKEYCCHKIDKRIGEILKKRTRQRVALETKVNFLRQYQASVSPRDTAPNSKTTQSKLVPRQPTLPKISAFQVEYNKISTPTPPVVPRKGFSQSAAPSGSYPPSEPIGTYGGPQRPPPTYPLDAAGVRANAYHQTRSMADIITHPAANLSAPSLVQSNRSALGVNVLLRTATSPGKITCRAERSVNEDVFPILAYPPATSHVMSMSNYPHLRRMPHRPQLPVRASLLYPLAADSLADLPGTRNTVCRRDHEASRALPATQRHTEGITHLAYTRRRPPGPNVSECVGAFPAAPWLSKPLITDVTTAAALRRHYSGRGTSDSESAAGGFPFRPYHEAGEVDFSLPSWQHTRHPAALQNEQHIGTIHSSFGPTPSIPEIAASTSESVAVRPPPVRTDIQDDVPAAASPPFVYTSYEDRRESIGGVTSFSFSFGNAPPIDDDKGIPRSERGLGTCDPDGVAHSFADDSQEDDPFGSTVLLSDQSLIEDML